MELEPGFYWVIRDITDIGELCHESGPLIAEYRQYIDGKMYWWFCSEPWRWSDGVKILSERLVYNAKNE